MWSDISDSPSSSFPILSSSSYELLLILFPKISQGIPSPHQSISLRLVYDADTRLASSSSSSGTASYMWGGALGWEWRGGWEWCFETLAVMAALVVVVVLP